MVRSLSSDWLGGPDESAIPWFKVSVGNTDEKKSTRKSNVS